MLLLNPTLSAINTNKNGYAVASVTIPPLRMPLVSSGSQLAIFFLRKSSGVRQPQLYGRRWL